MGAGVVGGSGADGEWGRPPTHTYRNKEDLYKQIKIYIEIKRDWED
jgi:hypothetical protein